MNKTLQAILFLSVLFARVSDAQKTNFFNNRLLENKLHYGFLWPHHSSISYSINGHVPAFEINLLKQATDENQWGKLYRYPRTGYGISYFYLQDHQVFGSAWGTYGLVDIPIFSLKKVTSAYRIYGGLSWLTEIWDMEDNYLQIAIGSHVNLYFRTAFMTRFKITNKHELIWDLGFTHFSNGNIKRPNLGLNIVTTSLGYIYSFNPELIENYKPEKNPSQKKVTYNLWHAGGVKAENHFKNDYYYKSALCLHAGYNINNKRLLGLGTDIMYDGTRNYHREPNDSLYQKASDLWQIGLVGFHDLTFNKLILTLQAGVYIYHRHHYRPIYNRVGLKYKIKKNVFISICLKSHKTQADYIEWGIGYIL